MKDEIKKFNNFINEDNNTEKRYVATVNFYVYAKSDKEALEQMEKFCDKQITKEDNQCSLVNLYEQPFGTTISRNIYGD